MPMFLHAFDFPYTHDEDGKTIAQCSFPSHEAAQEYLYEVIDHQLAHDPDEANKQQWNVFENGRCWIGIVIAEITPIIHN